MPKPVKHKCYINGEWVPAKDHLPVINPYTGEIIALMPVADDRLIDRALESASDAFKPYSRLARDQRADFLRKIEQGIKKNEKEFVQSIVTEGGKPVVLARGEVERAQLNSRLSAEEATRFGGEWLALDIVPGARKYTGLVGRVPIGPTIAISPFNFPLNLIMHKLAPALAVGCSVIIKPSSETPLTALKLGKVCHDAGLPPGAVQVVPCPGTAFKRAITDDRPAMVSFTGSPKVGWGINEISGRKRVALELGGNAAAVVHEDADLKFAATRIAFGGFAHAGQICISVQRVFVHKPIYDKFVPMLLKECRKIKSGDPSDEKVICGPMITPDEADRVQEWVKEGIKAGAKPLLKGGRSGNVLKPVVLEGAPRDAKVSCGEVFGPVITVAPYKTWDEVLEMVNDSIYGLQAGLFTMDLGRIKAAYDELEVGGVIINDIPTIRVDNYPYGGVKESGRGREGIRCTMVEMSEERVLVLRI